MSGVGTPQTVYIEFTRDTGQFFPETSTASTTGTLEEGSSSPGVTVEIGSGSTPGSTTIGVDLAEGSANAGVGSSLPATGTTGQLFYDTGTGHLYCWNAGAWNVV